MKHVLMFVLALTVFAGIAVFAVALEVGDRFGPVKLSPGGVICDTEAQARQAIDRFDRKDLRMVDGCGVLKGRPYALIEAIATHDSGRAVYVILKVIFLPPVDLGVQYAWQAYSSVLAPAGLSV